LSSIYKAIDVIFDLCTKNRLFSIYQKIDVSSIYKKKMRLCSIKKEDKVVFHLQKKVEVVFHLQNKVRSSSILSSPAVILTKNSYVDTLTNGWVDGRVTVKSRLT
jgi:hypothetical protein